MLSCHRCSAGPLTRTKYVPAEPNSVVVPSLPAVAQLGDPEAARPAHTVAPATGGPPSMRVTSTRSGVAAPAVGAVAIVGAGGCCAVEQAMARTTTGAITRDRQCLRITRPNG